MPPKRKKKGNQPVLIHHETRERCKRLQTLPSDRPATTLPPPKDIPALEQALPKALSLPDNVVRSPEFLVVLRVENKVGIVPYSDMHLPRTLAEHNEREEQTKQKHNEREEHHEPWLCGLQHPHVEVMVSDVRKYAALLKREYRRATRLKGKLFRCLDVGMKALQKATDQEQVVERCEDDWHQTYLSGEDYWTKKKVSRFPQGSSADISAEKLPEDTVIILDGSCPEARTEVLKALGDGVPTLLKPILPKRYNLIVFGLPDKDMRMTSWRPNIPSPGQRAEHVSTAITWLNSLPIKEAKAKKKRPSSAPPGGRRKGPEVPIVLDAIKWALQMKPRRIWVAARGGSLDKADAKAEETRALLKTCDVATKGAGVPFIVQKAVLWDATESDALFWAGLTGTRDRVDTIDTKKELGDLSGICKSLKGQKKKVSKAQTKFGKLSNKVPPFLTQLREQLHKQWAIERLLRMDLDECKAATKRPSAESPGGASPVATREPSPSRSVPRLDNAEMRKTTHSPEPSEQGSTRAPSTAALSSDRSSSRPESAMTRDGISPATSRPESAVTRPQSAGMSLPPTRPTSAGPGGPPTPSLSQVENAHFEQQPAERPESAGPRPPAGERPDTAGPRARMSRLRTSAIDSGSPSSSRPQSATERTP